MRVNLRVTIFNTHFVRYKITLEKRKKEGKLIEENVPIRITINHNNERLTLSTGYRTDLKAWDSKKQCVKQGFNNKQGEPYNLINSKLSLQASFIDGYSSQHQLEKKEIDLEDFKIKFAKEFERKKNTQHGDGADADSFFKCLDKFIFERGNQNTWTKATNTKFATVKSHLEGFDIGITFDGLDEKKLMGYVTFLRTDKKMVNSTIKKHIGFLKWFLNWAAEKGYAKNLAFKTFNPKLKTADNPVIYLTSKELDILRNYRIPAEKAYLERVRDVFLFCCYTSLRHSDVFNLKRSHIKDDKIEIVTQKTTDSLSIKLNSKAKMILQKYNQFKLDNDKALPVISNQKMNVYLQKLCELAQIKEPITLVSFTGNKRTENTFPKHKLIGTHTGRRTFICNALLNGMPVHAVMKITGHSDFKAMQPYVDIVSKEVDNMMDKFTDF